MSAYNLKNNLAVAKLAVGAIAFFLIIAAVLAPLAGAATIDSTVVTATPGNPITVTAGQTTTVAFQINMAASGKLDSRITATNPSTTKVQTQYYLTGGVASSKTWSSSIAFYDGGNTVAASQNNVVAASITIDSTTPAGNYQVDVVVATPTNPSLNPAANANQLLSNPNAPAKILVHVQAAATPTPSPTTTPDTTPPTITAPANINFEGNTKGGANIPATLNLGTPTVSDNKDPAPLVTNIFVGGFVAVGQSLTVTWTATDASGNSATATQTVTVVDTTPPTLTVPASFTFEGNTLGGANIPATQTLGLASASDIVDAAPAITNDFIGGYVALGQTLTITWTAIDASGNKATATQTITVIDTTAPTITTQAIVSTEVNAPKTVLTATAYDIVWGNIQLTNDSPATFQPGTTTVTWTATDGSGNTAKTITKVTANYDFIGFLSPLNNDGTSTAKAGSTIPIKFQLTDYYGNYYTTATATSITYTKVTATTLGAPVAALAQGATVFRYDTTSNQYIYNWGTLKGVTGTYQLSVALNDGSVHTVNVTLK